MPQQGFIFRAETPKEILSQIRIQAMPSSARGSVTVGDPSHTFKSTRRGAMSRLRFNRSQHS